MNNTNFDPDKFEQDAYGNLYPKPSCSFEDCTCLKAQGETLEDTPDVEPDAEIMNEYGLE
jgi:hypothetical protein